MGVAASFIGAGFSLTPDLDQLLLGDIPGVVAPDYTVASLMGGTNHNQVLISREVNKQETCKSDSCGVIGRFGATLAVSLRLQSLC